MLPHSHPAESHSFVGTARETAAMPPAMNRSFISIQMVHTHTHTRQELDPSSDRLGTESRCAGVLGLAPCHNDRNIYIYREREV